MPTMSATVPMKDFMLRQQLKQPGNGERMKALEETENQTRGIEFDVQLYKIERKHSTFPTPYIGKSI